MTSQPDLFAAPPSSPPALSAVPPLPGYPTRWPPRSAPAPFFPATQTEVRRDLAYASALIDVSERLRDQPDLPGLLSAVATEAATLVEADDVAVVHCTGLRRTVVDVHVPSYIDDRFLIEAARAAGQEPCLMTPGCTADLAADPRWADRRGALTAVIWRSVMTVPLASPSRQDQVRLSWFSRTPSAFTGQERVAELFSRHAGLAIRALTDR